jgi:hypothetical protein
MKYPGRNDTIQEGKEYLRANFDKPGSGVPCPCCGQNVKLVPRKLSREMVKWLVHLVRQWEQHHDWINMRKYPTQRGDYAYLKHWKLCEQEPENPDPTKTRSGYWRPTRKGIDFVYDRIKLPSHALVFDKKCYAFREETQVTIHDSMGEFFDIRELRE